MSVLASPTSPTTILTGSVSTSRQRRSIFLRKVALKSKAGVERRRGRGGGREEKGEGGERRGREGRGRGGREGEERRVGRGEGKGGSPGDG